MLIKKKEYYKLINSPKVPPEIGGILAGSKRTIVDTVIFDRGISHLTDLEIKYIPDIVYLNKQVSLLYKNRKNFLGMFHTHAYQWDSLSNADVQYIVKIMRKMPKDIEWLFFPIIYPGRSIQCYVAKRVDNQIKIIEDKVEII